MLTRDLSFDPRAPEERRTRRLLAAALRAASRSLDALAFKLVWAEATHDAQEAVLEFHADAGAPEGALYVNGKLVGHILGVQRL